MRIEYDPEKRSTTLKERGLDFSRAAEVFQGVHFTAQEIPDSNTKKIGS